MTSKTCGRCSRSLPLAAFTRDKSRKDGLSNKCRTCKRELNDANYQRRKETRMNEDQDRMVCYLDVTGEHKLAYDANQWIVQKRQKNSWRPLAYVGSTNEVLFRVCREHGIELTDLARRVVTMLPRFLDWKEAWPDSGSDRAQEPLQAA